MNFKKELIKVLGGIVYIILLILFLRYFQFGFWGVYITLLSTSLIIQAFTWFKQKKAPKLFNLLKNAVILLIMMIVLRWFYKFGIWGFIISCLLISALIIIRKWKRYLEVKHHVEAMLWGKPLHKFKSGKDIPKLKFVLKK